MIQYKINNSMYSLSYRELQQAYEKYVYCLDDVFITELTSVLHLACVINWLKETSSSSCLSDEGIIHELIHLLDIKDYNDGYKLKQIRELFNRTCELK